MVLINKINKVDRNAHAYLDVFINMSQILWDGPTFEVAEGNFQMV